MLANGAPGSSVRSPFCVVVDLSQLRGWGFLEASLYPIGHSVDGWAFSREAEMHIRSFFVSTFCLAFAIATNLALGVVPESATECADCHGDNGVSKRSEIPTIAGMSEFYLEGQMQAYQKQARPCPQVDKSDKSGKTDMCEVAKKLSAAQVKEVVTYFAGEKFVAAEQPVDAKLAAEGKSIHDMRCESCHSDAGSLADDDAGILAGQWKPYLIEALKEFSEGKRAEPEKMKSKTEGLTEADFKSLAEYYASESSR
jgi:cytochrome subunit of sulfide dehydrogenase